MNPIIAESIMAVAGRAVGMTVKTTAMGYNTFLPATSDQGRIADEGIRVSLSAAAKQISQILKEGSNSSASSADGFDDFIQEMHKQLLSKGKTAEALTKIPKNSSPARTTLAQQAANYLSVGLYGGDKVYEGVSSDNPFASLDRASLSSMAFDSSGSFTSAERQVAFLEMTTRDTEYENKTFDFQGSLSGKDSSVPWGDIISNLRDSELASTMSEGERLWRKWPSADELKNNAERLIKQFNVKPPVLPWSANLQNSNSTALAATAGHDGSASWKTIAINKSTSMDFDISLIRSVEKIDGPFSTEKPSTDSAIDGKSLIYQEIDNFKSE